MIKVFSHLNAPSRAYSRSRLYPGQDLCCEDEVLFSEPVRFVGDRVAAVVATSQAIADAAVRLIAVEYGCCRLCSLRRRRCARPRAAFTRAAICSSSTCWRYGEPSRAVPDGEQPGAVPRTQTVTSTTSTPRIHHAALEPHACLAQYDASGKLTIWGATQGVYGVRTVVADLLDLDYNRVRVIKVPMGGSFGGKSEFILEPVTAFMAMETATPRETRARPRGVHGRDNDSAGDHLDYPYGGGSGW